MERISVGRRILYFIIALPGFFLLTNNYPYLAIASIVLIVLLGIIFLCIKKKITSEHFGVIKVLSFLYFYFILSYFVSSQTIKNFFTYDFLRNDGNFFFCYILFFALAVPYFDYKKAAEYYFKILFFTFSITAVIGIAGYISQKIPFIFKYWDENYYKGTFTFLNFAHNATGSVFAMVCIFFLVFGLMEIKNNYKVFYYILLCICLAGLLLTRSRGSYISFAVGTLIVLWLYFKSWKKFLITASIMAAVSAPLIYFTGAYKRIIMIFDLGEQNNSWRIVLWERALYMFKQSPIFGIGFGRFNDIIFPGTNNNFSFENMHHFAGFPGVVSFYIEPVYVFNTAHAHNSYLQFLAETGVLGLGALLLFWIICLRKVFKGYKITADVFSKKIFLSNIGAIAALLTIAFTENYFSATTIMMCLSMVTSLSLGIYWQETNKLKLKENKDIIKNFKSKH